MSARNRDRRRRGTQEKWARENAQVKQYRKKGPLMKGALQAKGCHLPFYELLDSAEEEFVKVTHWAMSEFSSLRGIYEIANDKFDTEDGWRRLGRRLLLIAMIPCTPPTRPLLRETFSKASRTRFGTAKASCTESFSCRSPPREECYTKSIRSHPFITSNSRLPNQFQCSQPRGVKV